MFLPTTSACENCFITLCSHCRTSALQSLYSPGLTHALRAYMEAHMGLTLPMFVYRVKLNMETDYGYKASLYGRKGRALHSMSPHLIASKRRAGSPHSCYFCSFYHFIPQCLLCFPAFSNHPPCLTLSVFTVSTLLCSNVFPVFLTRGYRQKGNLSQRQTDSSTTDCYKLWHQPPLKCWRGAFYHVTI